MLRRVLLPFTAALTMVLGTAAASFAALPEALHPDCSQAGPDCGEVIFDEDGLLLGAPVGDDAAADPAPEEVADSPSPEVEASHSHDHSHDHSHADEASTPEPVEAAPAPPAPEYDPATVWDRLAQCESSGNWQSTVGLYEGGLQFHPQTWDGYKPAGYPGAAYEASREQQIHVAERVLASQGWGAWPACSAKLGLR